MDPRTRAVLKAKIRRWIMGTNSKEDMAIIRKALLSGDLLIQCGGANIRIEEMERWGVGNYKQTRKLSREIGDEADKKTPLGNRATNPDDLKRIRQAIEGFKVIVADLKRTGDKSSQSVWLADIGSAYYELGENDQAIKYFEEALAITRENGNKRGEEQFLEEIRKIKNTEK